jgi:sporulation protein YlmC with PRC-barrel domain
MPDRSTATIRVHDLVGRRVMTADERMLGRVVDLEIEHRDGFSVVGIELGRFGLLERIGLLRILGRQRAPLTVPWTSVERIDARAIRLRPGAPDPQELGAEETGPADEDSPTARNAGREGAPQGGGKQ